MARWESLSGHAGRALTTIAGVNPGTFSPGGATLNGQPVIEFLGSGASNQGLHGSFPLTQPYAAFLTVTHLGGSDGINPSIYDGVSGNTTRLFGSGGSNATTLVQWSGASISGAIGPNGTFSNVNNDWRLSGSGQNSFFRVNGAQVNTGSTGDTNPGGFSLAGGVWGASDQAANIRVSEVVLYSGILNPVQQRLVDNYLSARSGIAQNIGGGAVDIYAGDTPGLGNYDLDMFGIGRIDPDAITSSGASGFGIEATAGVGAAANQLNDGQFVAAGHRQEVNGLSSVITADGSSGQRWDRVWYVDTNGNSLDATLAFNFLNAGLPAPASGDEFSLLFSPTDPYSFSILAENPTLAGNDILFNLLDSQFLSGYYTLGVNMLPPLAPEPTSWLLATVGFVGLGAWQYRRRRTG